MSLSASVSSSQIRWRCRRGLLELDLLLNSFVALEYDQLSQQDVDVFLQLLDFSDQDLLDLLLAKHDASNVEVESLVCRIRRACFDDYNRLNTMQ